MLGNWAIRFHFRFLSWQISSETVNELRSKTVATVLLHRDAAVERGSKCAQYEIFEE
jgi:hypothetical protein